MDELKEMQMQMNALKDNLNKTAIVNHRLLKQVISYKMTSLNRIVWTEGIAFPFILLMLIGFCYALEINMWLVWTFAIMGTLDFLTDLRTLRIPVKELCSKSMMQIKDKLKRQKKERLFQNAIGLPLVIVWAVWFCLEIVKHFEMPSEIRNAIIIALVILVVSAIGFAIWLLFRIERTADSMINEIDEQNEIG